MLTSTGLHQGPHPITRAHVDPMMRAAQRCPRQAGPLAYRIRRSGRWRPRVRSFRLVVRDLHRGPLALIIENPGQTHPIWTAPSPASRAGPHLSQGTASTRSLGNRCSSCVGFPPVPLLGSRWQPPPARFYLAVPTSPGDSHVRIERADDSRAPRSIHLHSVIHSPNPRPYVNRCGLRAALADRVHPPGQQNLPLPRSTPRWISTYHSVPVL